MIRVFLLSLLIILTIPSVAFARHQSSLAHKNGKKKNRRQSLRQAKIQQCMESDHPGNMSSSSDEQILGRDVDPPTPEDSDTEYAQKHGWSMKKDVGYVNKEPFSIVTVRIDKYGKYPVELKTAIAFDKMARSAKKKGVILSLNSGFRTNDEQKKLRLAWCSRRRSAIAAVPGRSLHQAGYALDINVRNHGVMRWLNKHAHDFHFYRTVCSEAWHWEYSPTGEPLPMRYTCMSKHRRKRLHALHRRSIPRSPKSHQTPLGKKPNGPKEKPKKV